MANFTTSSGAVVDEQGNIIYQPPQTQAPTSAPIPAPAPIPTPTAQPTTTQPPVVTPTAPQTQVTAPSQTYTIQQGDTLGKLAAQYGTTVGALQSLNPQITDPNKIYTGQKLNITQEQKQPIEQPKSTQTTNTKTTPETPVVPETPVPTVRDTMQLYADALKTTNSSENLKEKNKYLDEAKTVTDEMNTQIEDLNNNPWLSAGSRGEQINKLKDKYALRLNTLSNFAKLYEAEYETDIATARYLATGMQEDQQFAVNLAIKKQEAIDALGKDNQIVSVNGRELLVNKSTGKVVTDLGATTKSSSGSGSSNVTTDNERALMTQFRNEQIVKDYNMILSQKGAVDNYIANGVGGPADLALVFSFMKGLDPTSVVRESEYAAAAKSGNLFQGVWAKFNGYLKEKGGILPANVRQEFQNLVNQKLASQTNLYNNVAKNYTDIATRQGLNPQNVVVDYAGAASTQNTGAPNFDNLLGDLTVNEATKKAYLPRSVWATVQDKDALLAEVMSEGYELLIND